jgi:hypothetical protein
MGAITGQSRLSGSRRNLAVASRFLALSAQAYRDPACYETDAIGD